MSYLDEFRTENPTFENTQKGLFSPLVVSTKVENLKTGRPLPCKTLKSPSDTRMVDSNELPVSKNRIEAADICVALVVTETASGMAISKSYPVQGEEARRQAWESGAVVFHPDEMYHYIQLDESERELFRSLKMIKQRREGRNE